MGWVNVQSRNDGETADLLLILISIVALKGFERWHHRGINLVEIDVGN